MKKFKLEQLYLTIVFWLSNKILFATYKCLALVKRFGLTYAKIMHCIPRMLIWLVTESFEPQHVETIVQKSAFLTPIKNLLCEMFVPDDCTF